MIKYYNWILSNYQILQLKREREKHVNSKMFFYVSSHPFFFNITKIVHWNVMFKREDRAWKCGNNIIYLGHKRHPFDELSCKEFKSDMTKT